MPWFCDYCGNRMYGAMCKCHAENYGATRVPPLDGFIFFNADGTGLCRREAREWEMLPCKKGQVPIYTKGVRPPGWKDALEVIGQRAAEILADGIGVDYE